MKEIIFAGFGGQGVLTGGLVIAEMASRKDRSAVWMPAYGPTMRGGKANCVVKYGETAEEQVGSPIMEEADILVAMNQPSLDYLEFCKPGVTIFANMHNISADYIFPEGSKVVRLDCAELAEKAKNPKGQSLVMVGAIMRYLHLFDADFARTCLDEFFAKKGKNAYAEANRRAFDAGYEAAV
ncbi:2-oxoacid:acceptor oxidoreductase family protein [Hominifimenecus sp. rT4P-3]|uniref:2-oxoacid:acceptor oxidoreductase family protein n=1 Tax=Hominifimenecus sp. rT4P-3 TaxID=3242979 RepID=UPI003DA309E5